MTLMEEKKAKTVKARHLRMRGWHGTRLIVLHRNCGDMIEKKIVCKVEMQWVINCVGAMDAMQLHSG